MEHGAEARDDVTLETLSPATREVLESRKLDAKLGSGQLFDLLREAEGMDLHASPQGSRYGCGCAFFGFFLLASSFMSLPFVLDARARAKSPEVLAVLGTIFLVCLVGTLYNRHYSSLYERFDVPNDFRNLVIPILDAIRNDVPRKAKVRVRLDLEGPTDAKEVQMPDSGYDGGIFWTYRRQYYHDPWCVLDAPLADGSRLVLEFWNDMLKRTRQRKGKVKWKKVSCARVTLVPPGEVFAWDAAATESGGFAGADKAKGKFKGEGPGRAATLVAKAKYKATYQIPDQTLPPETVLGMVMRLYKNLDARPAGGGGTP